MRVPDFLARQFYVAGSLRNRTDGFELQATNGMGDGTLVGIGPVEVDGRAIDISALSAVRTGEAERIPASSLSRMNPIHVRRGDRVTLIVEGPPLPPGQHELRVRLVELNLGALDFSIRDTLAA
jgi:hypothetical protein